MTTSMPLQVSACCWSWPEMKSWSPIAEPMRLRLRGCTTRRSSFSISACLNSTDTRWPRRCAARRAAANCCSSPSPDGDKPRTSGAPYKPASTTISPSRSNWTRFKIPSPRTGGANDADLQLRYANTADHERAGYSIHQHQWMEQISRDRNRAKPQPAADGALVRRDHHDADQHCRGRNRRAFEVLDLAGSIRQVFGRHIVAREARHSAGHEVA